MFLPNGLGQLKTGLFAPGANFKQDIFRLLVLFASGEEAYS